MSALLPEEFVIVIGRQFGAGGRILGREIASRLGIPYYDKELLSSAAERFGFRKEFFENTDERKPSIFQCMLNFNITSPTADYCSSAVTSSSLYNAQSSVIRQIADEGPCVIVGRTADYLLRDKKNLVSIYIHALPEERARRCVRRGDAADIKEGLTLAQKHDKLREDYYNYFTGRQWGAASTYHLSIDTTVLTPEDTAEIVMSYIRCRIAASEKR